MKALSLWQPWATAMALGLKANETRHWPTRHRGLVAIHAAKRWTAEERAFLDEQRGLGCFPGKFVPIPLGAVVAIGHLRDVVRVEQVEEELSDLERQWGNYADGRYAWQFSDIVQLPDPIAFKGAQGIFDIPDEVLPAAFRS